MVSLLIPAGRDASASLVQALKWTPIAAVYTSPHDRAVETAHPLAADHGLDVRVRAALTDTDATGATGESLSAVQQRIVDELVTLARTHDGETIVVITHADPIRCALAAFGGNGVDDLPVIEFAPGHVSAVGIQSGMRRVLGVNLPAADVAV